MFLQYVIETSNLNLKNRFLRFLFVFFLFDSMNCENDQQSFSSKMRFENFFDSTNFELIFKLKRIHIYSSKSNQLKIIKCFINDRNVVFSAKTDYDKNMILYFAFALNFDDITLLIYSLNVLKIDQNKIIRKLKTKVNSYVVNDEIMTDELLNEIENEKYIHILINFEFVLFNIFFRNVLQTFFFRNRFFLIVIDEIYLIYD